MALAPTVFVIESIDQRVVFVSTNRAQARGYAINMMRECFEGNHLEEGDYCETCGERFEYTRSSRGYMDYI